MNYRAPKILAMVKAVAVSHGIAINKLHVSHGAALVLHGILTETDDIEIQVDAETWSTFTEWHRPLHDASGCHLVLPNKVTIWKMDDLVVEHQWETRSEVRVATVESLERMYAHFLEKAYPHREHKKEADIGKVAACKEHLDRYRRLVHDAKCKDLKNYAPQILGIPALMNVLNMAAQLAPGEKITTEAKDANNIRWEISLNERVLSVKELTSESSVLLQQHYIYNLNNIHRMIKE